MSVCPSRPTSRISSNATPAPLLWSTASCLSIQPDPCCLLNHSPPTFVLTPPSICLSAGDGQTDSRRSGNRCRDAPDPAELCRAGAAPPRPFRPLPQRGALAAPAPRSPRAPHPLPHPLPRRRPPGGCHRPWGVPREGFTPLTPLCLSVCPCPPLPGSLALPQGGGRGGGHAGGGEDGASPARRFPPGCCSAPR